MNHMRTDDMDAFGYEENFLHYELEE